MLTFSLQHVVYCRFEIYLGKKQHDTEQQSFDNKTGAAAVVRNLGKVVTDDDKRNGFRVVTIDRYYSGVPLIIQLLSLRVYAVGTIMTNRLGYCKEVIDKNKKRRATDVRGSFKMSRCLDIPTVLAISWLDNKPVHFLSSGATGCKSSVTRRGRNNQLDIVPCPNVVRDYHRFMGGVDVHDQLRLQNYSLQTCYRFKKYYKSLFMGMIDLVIVNAYVTHAKCSKDLGVQPLKRSAFMTLLHKQLIQQTRSDFETDRATPTADSGARHTIRQNDSFRTSGAQSMRRRNACKVCSIKFRKKGEKSNETSWYCEQCSEDNKRLFLCNTIRAGQGNSKTCFDIWHQDWRCKVPASASSYIQMRPTIGQRKRKRVRRALLGEEGKSGHEDDHDDDEVGSEDFGA